MTLLQQILHRDPLGASTGASEGGVLLVIGSEAREIPRLFESGVAYVAAEANPLLVLARSCPLPDGYGNYEVDETERSEDEYPDDFGMAFEPGFDEEPSPGF